MPTKDIDSFIKWILKDKTLLREIFAGDKEEATKTPCLTDEAITGILENKLSVARRDSFMAHLTRCDECLDIFVATYKVLNPETLSVADEIISKVKSYYKKMRRFVMVIKLFPDHIAPLILEPGFTQIQIPVPGTTRGYGRRKKANHTVVTKKTPPFLFELEIEKIKENLCQIQVYVCNIISNSPSESLRLSLYKDNRELDSYILEEGKVVFDDVKKGRYLIKASEKGKHVCEFDLSLV